MRRETKNILKERIANEAVKRAFARIDESFERPGTCYIWKEPDPFSALMIIDPDFLNKIDRHFGDLAFGLGKAKERIFYSIILEELALALNETVNHQIEAIREINDRMDEMRQISLF